jgi:hypothetical protein
MKFFIYAILSLILLYAVSSNFLNSQNNKLNKSHDNNFKAFVTEAHGHMNPADGNCSNPSQCRTLNECLYIAYKRSIGVKDELKLETVYVAGVFPHNSLNGVTKVLMAAPGILGTKNKNDVQAAPLFRVCIPTDRAKKSFVDISCPMLDCPATLEEAQKCEDDPSVPLNQAKKK